MSLRYLSVCSGIEAATQAWHPLGWVPVAFSEIEPFPCAVLAHHYPGVPNWGDMTKFQEWTDADVDVLCGGTPCQSFSVAGLRQGLADPRGNLMLTFGAIAARYRAKWLVWENVPGVLSSNGGRDFGTFLGMLGQLGYGVAYRVLDAQHVRTRRFPRAVPQRRRRVFVVGYLGDWRRAAAVLFDRESLSGHPAPRREAGQGITAAVAQGVALRSREGGGTAELTGNATTALRATAGGGNKPHALIAADVAHVLETTCHDYSRADGFNMIAHTLRGEGHDASEDGTGRQNLVPVAYRTAGDGAVFEEGDITAPLTTATDPNVQIVAIQERAVSENVEAGPGGKGYSEEGSAYTLEARNKVRAVAFDLNQITSKANRSQPDPAIHHTLPATSTPPHLATPWAVRRLLPVECEALQAFPRNFTRIPYRGKPADQCPDGPRYKALGNSWAVNCAEWIGERIAEVDAWS